MAVLNLVPTDEERMLREAVRGICSGLGQHDNGGSAADAHRAGIARDDLNNVAEHSLGLPKSY